MLTKIPDREAVEGLAAATAACKGMLVCVGCTKLVNKLLLYERAHAMTGARGSGGGWSQGWSLSHATAVLTVHAVLAVYVCFPDIEERELKIELFQQSNQRTSVRERESESEREMMMMVEAVKTLQRNPVELKLSDTPHSLLYMWRMN